MTPKEWEKLNAEFRKTAKAVNAEEAKERQALIEFEDRVLAVHKKAKTLRASQPVVVEKDYSRLKTVVTGVGATLFVAAFVELLTILYRF